jgi:hypothetical protein
LFKFFTLLGSMLSRSLEITVCFRAFRMSTNGDSPVTVTVSSSAPTFNSAFTVAAKPEGSSMPSRLNVLKPVSSTRASFHHSSRRPLVQP